jgi:hypothetical protein
MSDGRRYPDRSGRKNEDILMRDVELTTNQAQFMLHLAVAFELPARLGKKAFTPEERVWANEEVRVFLAELKALSPYTRQTGKEFRTAFGRKEDWEEERGPKRELLRVSLKPSSRDREYKLKLSDEAMSGAVWCLEFALYPGETVEDGRGIRENRVATAQEADEFVWPIARRLRKTQALRKEIGLTEAPRRRLEDDPESGARAGGEAVGVDGKGNGSLLAARGTEKP